MILEGENRDHGQALGAVKVGKGEPHGRLGNNAQRAHEKNEV